MQGATGTGGSVTAQLQAVFPDSVAVGRRTTLLVVGLSTAFDGTTTFAAGADVTVHSVEALNGGALRVDITAGSAAALGKRNVTATTGMQTLTLTNGLTVSPGARGTVVAGALAQGGAATIRIEVTSGKQFNAVVSGTSLAALNTTVAGTGFTPIGVIRWLNSTTIDATVLINPRASTMTTPTLTVTFEDASTEVVALPTLLPTTGTALPLVSTAGTLSTIRGAVYAYDVTTAPKRLTATVTTTGTPTWTASTRIFDAAGLLLGSGTSAASAFLATNGTYYVAVNDSVGAGTNATFTVIGAETAVATNSVCSAPTALTLGTALTGEIINNGGAPLTGCLVAQTGPVRYYSFDLAAGDGATVRVTPTVAFNANIRAIDACAATTCSAFADNTTSSSTTSEVMSVRNTTNAVKTMIIAVGSAGGTTTGTYTVTATRQPYQVTTLATACEDMTMATALVAAPTDDGASPNTPLPFPVSYFGTAMASFSASNNGGLTLFTGATGTSTFSFTNAIIPSSGANNVVAPFWDDLVPVTGTTRIDTRLTGTAGSQTYVVQWTADSFSGGAERLTFQTKFFEANSAIEFHYCSMIVNAGTADRVTGNSATVGLSNATSSDTSVGVSFNTAGSVSTATALRFVPAP